MRKAYLEPEMETSHFYLEDIVCRSGDDNDPPITKDPDEFGENEIEMG